MLFTSVKVKIFSVTTMLSHKCERMIMLGRNIKTMLYYKCLVKAALLRKGSCNKESRIRIMSLFSRKGDSKNNSSCLMMIQKIKAETGSRKIQKA